MPLQGLQKLNERIFVVVRQICTVDVPAVAIARNRRLVVEESSTRFFCIVGHHGRLEPNVFPVVHVVPRAKLGRTVIGLSDSTTS